MIEEVQIFSDFSSKVRFHNETSLFFPPSITPITYTHPKKKKNRNNTSFGDNRDYYSFLPSKVIQNVDCMSSSVLPLFQSAISFLNLHIPSYSFVYSKSLLDRKMFRHKKKFISDTFLLNPDHIITKNGTVQIGSKNGLAALTLHEDGVHIEFKYFSLVFQPTEKNEKEDIFNLYTWEVKYYTTFQLKEMKYLLYPLAIIEEIQNKMKSEDFEGLEPTIESMKSGLKKSEQFKFPENICFSNYGINSTNKEDATSLLSNNNDFLGKSIFLDYNKTKNTSFRAYSGTSSNNKNEKVYGEMNLGNEGTSLVYCNEWESVLFCEDIGGKWEKRIYPRNTFHLVSVEVKDKIFNLFNFLKKKYLLEETEIWDNEDEKENKNSKYLRNLEKSIFFEQSKNEEEKKKASLLMDEEIFDLRKDEQRRRNKCEFENNIGVFKCFGNGTIHINFKDGSFLEEKNGVMKLISNGVIYDSRTTTIPGDYLFEFQRWRKWVEMSEEERLEQDRKNQEIKKLLVLSRERMKDTQKIINKNKIDSFLRKKNNGLYK